MPVTNASFLFILLFFVWIGRANALAQSGYRKLSDEEMQASSLKTAQTLAEAMLTAQKKGQAYTFSETEATPAIRGDFSAEKQLQTYSAIKELFGDYQSLTFVEAYQTTNAPAYQIFRFRGDFEKGTTQPEVRVVLNDSTQLAGFFITPWQEVL
uniref:Uncharacterized protein n=1 Tax=Roseihalotalea indica TaxID=2867963 RepID=A0AA49JJF9_9BACT|nr:hypothetical protein K4G66_13810 [Tunicatimonas sp. TK19036]